MKDIEKNKEDKLSVTEFIRENLLVMLMLLFLLAGILSGAFAASQNSGEAYSYDTYESYAAVRTGRDFMSLFYSSFAGTIPYLIISVVLSMTCFGAFFIPVAVFIRGLGIGAVIGSTYSSGGVEGLACGGLMIAVPLIITTFALILSCAYSARMSFKMLTLMFAKNRVFSMRVEMGSYFRSHMLYLAITIAGCMVDAIMSLIFAEIFSM